MENSKRRISILGCGWYGTALATVLLAKGYAVKGSTTSPGKLPLLAAAGIDPYLVQVEAAGEYWAPGFLDCDILFLCLPPGLRQGTPPAYLQRMHRVVQAIVAQHLRQVVFISSTGVYGNPHGVVDETTLPQPASTSGQALLAAEKQLLAESTFTTTLLRFAGLVGPNRDPGRFFAGQQQVPNGLAPVNLVHLTDCTGISLAVLEQHAFGLLCNVCAPHHPSKAAFYTRAAKEGGYALPSFKEELLEWKKVNSVVAGKQLQYHFAIPNWFDLPEAAITAC